MAFNIHQHSFNNFIISFVIIISFFSCNYNKDINFAYLGGEIVNPKSKTVILYNTNGKISDTLTLDNKNRFIHKVTHLKSGLYSIRHGDEYQMVLLEANDSIMFRLNTHDFDESLVYTGKGSKKNNYLIKTYLDNETESKRLVKYAQKEPKIFSSLIEKRRQKQLTEFDAFLKKNKTSDFFKSIIRANINYNAFADKEIYPFIYFGNNKLVHVKDLPEDFYVHRSSINYNASELSHFFSYNRFLFSHINNLALK